MNIEIADRLVKLRKANGFSQEMLAEKLGISRQAVSKWERAEASPDTDNLILLSRLYNISLDELLRTEDEIPECRREDGENELAEYEAGGGNTGEKPAGSVTGYEEPEENGRERYAGVIHFPLYLLVTIVYFIIGCFYGAWHPGWILFLLPPIGQSLAVAVERRNANCFAYPVLAVVIYLCLGFFFDAWHPGWIIYLTIPFYYSLISWIRSVRPGDGSRAGDSGEGTGGRDEE